jgi:predicted secreted protein
MPSKIKLQRPSKTEMTKSTRSNLSSRRGFTLPQALAFVTAMICAHPALFAQQQPKSSAVENPPITSAAVWNPSPDALAAIRKKCGEAGDPGRQENCFLDEMKAAGASPEAIAFSKSVANRGVIYMRGFRQVERVDVAHIEYVFRANELDGVFLVNGDPSPIDVDDDDLFPKSKLQANGAYAALAKQYPNISLWPGDRLDPKTPTLSNPGWGAQSLLVNYILRDGCHACTQIGTATVNFDFDNQGKFEGIRVASVVASKDSSAPSGANTFGTAGVEQIRVLAGQEFSITLHANHTTGYSWRLVTTLDPANLKLIGNVYNVSTSHSLGAPGVEVWTFGTAAKGTVQLHFELVRPWDKDAPPAKTADYSVVIE